MKKWGFIFFLLLPFIIKAQLITTFAGNGSNSGPIGDGGPATAAMIYPPSRGAFDKKGNFYFGCNGNRIRKVDTAGIITTIAGNGVTGYSGDGISATAAELNGVGGIHFDSVNLFQDIWVTSPSPRERVRVRSSSFCSGFVQKMFSFCPVFVQKNKPVNL